LLTETVFKKHFGSRLVLISMKYASTAREVGGADLFETIYKSTSTSTGYADPS